MRIHAAGEHVVSPNAEAKDPDGNCGINHGAISKYRPAGKGRKQMRSDSHSGKNRDVHFGMSKEPEQVLPQQRRATLMLNQLAGNYQSRGLKEAAAEMAVHKQHSSRSQ